MSTPQEARRLFSRILRLQDQEINLAEAALLIAAEQGSDVNVELCNGLLDSMSWRVRATLEREGVTDPRHSPAASVRAINRVLFDEEGFSGNHDDYYDPENSYLDRVLIRRTGIPITISIVYMEVARRTGLPLHGIGLPGHFLVGYWAAQDDPMPWLPQLIVDPFNEGALLDASDCAARIHAAYGEDVPFSPEWLQPMPHRQVLARILNNLQHIYRALRQDREALRAIDMLLLVQPDAVWERRERGMIYYRLGVFVPALADLRCYLKSAAADEDTELVRYYVQLLQRLVVSHN